MDSKVVITTPRRRSLAATFFDNIFLLCGLTVFAWSLEVVDWFLGHRLDHFGIWTRRIEGLTGILTAHWLHGGFPHLLSNTLPFLMLGGFVLLGGRALFWKLSIFVAILGGTLLWLFGDLFDPVKKPHLGSSLVIFGYLGFLLTRGFLKRANSGSRYPLLRYFSTGE